MGRRRAGSCPPSLCHNGEAKGDGGPEEAPVGPQPSKRKTPEDTLMVVDAVMAQGGREPLEEEGRQERDPMLQEASLIHEVGTQVGGGRETQITSPPELQQETGHQEAETLGYLPAQQDGASTVEQQQVGLPLNDGSSHQLHTTTYPVGSGRGRELPATKLRTNRTEFVASITKKVAQPLIHKAKGQSVTMPKQTRKGKAGAVEAPRRSGRIAKKPGNGKPMEQQAVELLMKKTGALTGISQKDEHAIDQFASQFAQPLTDQIITDIRDMFGINKTNHDPLAAIAAQAGEVETI